MSVAPATLEGLRDALASGSGPMRIRGAGTKRHVPAEDAAQELDLRALTGVVSYDPAECVVSVLAGTPVREIEAALAAHRQYLPFDPMCRRAGATIGGTVGSGLSGSCRLRYGGVRDFVIGARVVDGAGRLIHTGGQVVKNAAGFLLHHALVGSAGRLGAIGELTFKVFPSPDARATVEARCSTFGEACAVHERIRSAVRDLEALDLDGAGATVWVRLAGAAEALPERMARVRAAVEGPSRALEGDEEERAWTDAAEFAWAPAGAAVVKIPSAPSRLLALDSALGPFGARRFACAGAVVWLATARPLADVDAMLTQQGWRGAVVRGADHGRLLGPRPDDAFGARVHGTLDPSGRFV